MNSAPNTRSGFSRALACVVFASASRYLFATYPILHWGVLSDYYTQIPEGARTKLFEIMFSLDVVYRGLALAAVIWCAWSWAKEPFYAAAVASAFALYALAGAVVMM